MPYCFHNNIIEEEKLKFKKMIKGIKNLDNNIGIFLGHDTINPVTIANLDICDYIKYFNELSVTFYVSRDVFIILNHFKNIINFVTSRDRVEQSNYFVTINVINENSFNCTVVPFPIYKGSSPGSYSFEIKQSDTYHFTIINDNIIDIKKGFNKWSGHDSTGKPYPYSSSLYLPFNLTIQYLSHNLIDQLITTKNVKKDRAQKDYTQYSLNNSNTIVKIITNQNNIHNINFTNCNDFGKLEQFLVKRFGQGKFIHEIDLETEIETIKYVIN